MVAITPIGIVTFLIFSPFGRLHSLKVISMGSFSLATTLMDFIICFILSLFSLSLFI